MFRLIFGISLFVLFTMHGGWAGFGCALAIIGVLGFAFPPQARAKPMVEQEKPGSWEKVEQARRGREIDPTRPSDDHPMLLTNEVRRRR